MLTKTSLILLTALIFQSCNLSTSNFEKDQSIDAATRVEIKRLNDKLFNGITTNNLTEVKSLMLPALVDKFGGDINKLISQIKDLEIDNYSILDEYSNHASASGIIITLPSGNNDNNDYIFTYASPSKDSYVSLLLLNNFGNQFLLTVVYGKYPDGWKLNIFKFGQYSFFGKTASDYFKMAQTSYKKSFLIDAVNNISLSNVLLRPADTHLQFVKEKEIKDFEDSIMQDVNAKYQFPLTITAIDSKPKVFRIFPQPIQEGFFPMVCYLTDINLKDTAALRLENKNIRKEVDSIFKGIDKDKRFIFYRAFNEMPTEQKEVNYHGFVDTLKVR
ncbi:MAG: hypothetical protein ACTHOF_05445 [Flavisolibacter sp.]